jgi:hypothetical protein
VNCAKADKKNVQAIRYEWWGFLAAGDCPAALPVINLLAKHDCFSLVFCTKKIIRLPFLRYASGFEGYWGFGGFWELWELWVKS